MKEFRPKMLLVQGVEASSLLAPAEQFRLWLQKARAGERMVYACAFWLPPAGGACVIALVREAFNAGEVRLLQRRLPAPPEGPGGFDYLVQRREQRLRPAVRFTPRTLRDDVDALFAAPGAKG